LRKNQDFFRFFTAEKLFSFSGCGIGQAGRETRPPLQENPSGMLRRDGEK